MDERGRRVGENEALFRQVNERIEDVNRTFATLTSHMDIICECGSAACAERLKIGLGDYERVRADAQLFIVLPGHELLDVEELEERHEDWFVVRKSKGEPAELAEETDPRR